MVEDNIMKENENKIIETRNKIKDCNGNFLLVCIDVDGLIFNIESYMQEILESIDHRSTKEYLREIVSLLTNQEYDEEKRRARILMNAILEETKCEFENADGQVESYDFTKPLINYERAYILTRLFPRVVEPLNYLLENRPDNVFYVFVSHRNPEREGELKVKILNALFPKNDGILTPSFHKAPGSVEINAKGEIIKEAFQLNKDEFKNVWLLDDDKSNGKSVKEQGGKYIQFLSNGFDSSHTLFDRMTKISSISDLEKPDNSPFDPYNLSFKMTLIDYIKEHPEYVKELKAKDVKIKRK